MSAIYFHSGVVGEDDVRISGCERASMGCTLASLTWALLESHATEYESSPSILRKVLVDECWALNSQYYGHRFPEMLKLAVGVGGEDSCFIVDDVKTTPFTLQLNTGLRIGNDPLKLFARLHGQCEIHAWVDGPNRMWLSNIIEAGRKCGLYRNGMGWESAIDLLRKSDKGEIVTSYSVCDQFPNKCIADAWHDEREQGDWNDLEYWEQWMLAIAGLRGDPNMELKPSNWDNYHFGTGLDAFTLIEAALKRTPEPAVNS